MGCILDKSGKDEAKCSRKMVNGRRVLVATRSLVNARSLRLQCNRILHESLSRSRIRAIQMNNLRCLLDISKVPNEWIR